MSLNDLQHRKSKPYSKKYHRLMSSVDFLTPFSQKIQEAKNSPRVFFSCNISTLNYILNFSVMNDVFSVAKKVFRHFPPIFREDYLKHHTQTHTNI